MRKRPLHLNLIEERIRKRGYQTIAGVDEAGRGPLAGPVVAAACILPQGVVLEGIDDSKKLSLSAREDLYKRITENPSILMGVGIVEAVMIDQVSILQATLLAMVAAIGKLSQQPDYVLVDGNRFPSIDIAGEAIVKGDTLSQSIMAAAIIAKVTRDRIMVDFDKKWPEYGFAEHKGYPTVNHRAALQKLGPCPIHRQSYKWVGA